MTVVEARSENGALEEAEPASWVRRLWAWLTRRPCFGGLVGAAVFFAFSMTPSLLPRGWIVQGILSGLATAIGYGFGSAGSALVRTVLPSEPSHSVKRRAWLGLAIGSPLLVLLSVVYGARWDGELRKLMEMPLKEPREWIGHLLLAGIFAVVFVVIGRLLRGLGRLITRIAQRVLPRPAAVALGGVLGVALVVFVLLGGATEAIFRAIDSSAAVVDRTIQPDIDQPSSAFRSGSPDSLITWSKLGSKGREFTGKGPTVEELSAFAGRPAEEPIRVYVGLRAAGSLDDRVSLVLAEMDRTGAFDRPIIIVQIPSGNGEIPPVNSAAPEYMFAGDIAQVVLQYSYVPSFAALAMQPHAGDDAASAVIDAVLERVELMPSDARPRVFVAGESLGSLSVEAAFDDFDDMVDKVDGALFVGPTLVNEIRNDLTERRDEGSPVWLPVVDGGAIVRFAREPGDLDAPSATWDTTRVVYLQNSSDPVAWWEPEILWRPPDFLEEPRGPDVSPAMTWIPVVTFWQTFLDLPLGSGAPEGHGHRYGLNVVDAWAAILQPDGWTPDDTTRLRDQLDQR